MDIFNDKLLPWQPMKLLLCSLGAWPFQSHKKILSISVVFLVESIYIPEVIKFIKVWSNLTAMMDCMAVLIIHTITNVGLFVFLHHSETIHHLLSLIDIQWNKSDLTKVEINQLKQDGYEQRKTMVFYIFVIFFAGIFYAAGMPMTSKILDYISPLNQSRPKIILYHTEFFIDQDKYAHFFTIHLWLVCPVTTIIFVAYDVLYFNFIQHACTMFNVLGHRLQILNCGGMNISKNSHLKGGNDNINEYLKNCILMHTNILEFTKLMSRIFSMSFLVIMVVNLIGISVTAFQVLSDDNETTEKIRYTVSNVTQIMHLYLLCWYSQKLINSSGQIIHSIGKWYDIPTQSQRLIAFMTMRSRKPCVITAGGFAVMSIETFSSGIKTAMSYLTVLRSMQ